MNNTHTFNAGERRWLSGRRCLYKQASYNVSKGGINQLTRALALADKGIRVNAVTPGMIATFLASEAASYITGEIVFVDVEWMTLNYTVPGFTACSLLPAGSLGQRIFFTCHIAI